MKQHPLERRVLIWCGEHGLFRPGDRVSVALSGGSDSMALLMVLEVLAPDLGLHLSACHFHHRLRGAEADRDREFVVNWCAQRGIPLSLGEGDVPAYAAAHGQSVEQAARTLRYRFFESLSCDRIATAHTANDNIETLLLHLVRGTGPRGFTGIPVARGPYVRPLLCCTKEELLAYLETRGIPFVEDSTNAADHCRRNRLRRRVVPLLLEENPKLHRQVETLTDIAREEEAFLSGLARTAEESCRMEEGLSCAGLREQPPVLRRRILLSQLERYGVENPSFAFVKALEALVLSENPSAVLSLPKGLRAERRYDLLRFGTSSVSLPIPEQVLPVPGTLILPDGGKLRCFVTENSEIRHNSQNIFLVNYAMLTHELKVRSRKPGDRLRLSGGTKALNRLMMDRKIPAALRDGVPVLTADGRPFAVPGVGMDPAFRANLGETALVIAYTSEAPSPMQSGSDSGSPTQRLQKKENTLEEQ